MPNETQGYVKVAPVFDAWSAEDRAREQSRLVSSWYEIIQRDPYMRNVRMLIELRFGAGVGGKEIVISVDPINQTRSDGSIGKSSHGLLIDEPEIKNEYKMCEGASSARSLSLTLDARVIDPSTLIQNGVMLSGIAEVSLQINNGKYEERHVIIRGDISGGVSFGGRRDDNTFETMDLEVVDPRETVSSRLPPFVITAGRNGLVHPTAYGERYPILVNGFRRSPTIRLSQNLTGGNTFLVAASSEHSVTEVYLNGGFVTPADPVYPYTIDSEVDRYGTDYTVVRFTSPATTNWADTDTVYVVSEFSDLRTYTIIETIRYLLETYTSFNIQGLQSNLFTEADAKIPSGLPVPRVCVNGSGASNAADSISYIESSYCGSFPMISMAWERGGYGPLVTDFRTRPISHFVAGQFPIWDRSSLVQESDKASIVNQFTLKYAYDPVLDIYQGVEIRDGSNSALCQYSMDLFGNRESSPMESLEIHDQALAAYVVDWLASHKSLPSYYVEYEASPTLFLTARRSDTITITDAEFDWNEEKATIESITYRAGRCVVGIRVWVRFVDFDGGAYVVGNPDATPNDIQQLLEQAQQQQQQQQQQPSGHDHDMNVTNVTDGDSPYQATGSEDVVAVSHNQSFTFALPQAMSGRMITIKAGAQTNQQNTITVVPQQQQTIDGGANFVLTFSYSAITLISDGNNWLIL